MSKDIDTEFSMHDGELRRAVIDLLVASSISPWVKSTRRDGMFGGSVWEFAVTGPVPPEAWSTGEKLLWQFVLSIASGRGSVDLQQLTTRFRGTLLAESIVDVIEAALGREGKV